MKYMTEKRKNELKVLLADLAMYLADDTGAENDNHKEWIDKFIYFIEEERKDAARQAIKVFEN